MRKLRSFNLLFVGLLPPVLLHLRLNLNVLHLHRSRLLINFEDPIIIVYAFFNNNPPDLVNLNLPSLTRSITTFNFFVFFFCFVAAGSSWASWNMTLFTRLGRLCCCA